MSNRNADCCCVPNEVIESLYWLRHNLIWRAFRLPDECYDNVFNREGMAIDCGFDADTVEDILATLGVDLSTHYYEPHPDDEIEQMPVRKAWKKFWLARMKKRSGPG